MAVAIDILAEINTPHWSLVSPRIALGIIQFNSTANQYSAQALKVSNARTKHHCYSDEHRESF